MAAAGGELQSTHRYKLQPPYFTGDYATFEEWKHKMVAYLVLQNSEFPRLLQTAETSNMEVTDALLRDGATTPQEAQLWVQLSRDLLVSVCSGQAAVLCRQHSTQAQGLETWRQPHNRFSIPVGTHSVGYLTKLLKPQFNEQKFEESFTTWEFEIAQYERDNQAPIPDNIKIAVLLNETKGALQQYLQLRAGTIQRYADVRELILEYHRASTAFSKMQALTTITNTSAGSTDPQPMDIGLMYKGKGKHKGKGKSYTKDKVKERHNGTTKEKDTQDTTTVDMAKAKHKHQLVTAMRSKDQDTHRSKERQKVKDPLHGKETKEKAKEHATNADRWVTWQRDCRVRVYNVAEANRTAKHRPTTTTLL